MEISSSEQYGIHYLTPENTRIFRGTFRMMHVQVRNEGLYRGVFAVQAFPVSSPHRYICLFYYDDRDKLQEAGIIRDLDDFPPEARELVRESLNKYYFSYQITQIRDIRKQFGLLFFDVETDRGPRKFAMRSHRHCAVDLGTTGKILLDVFEDQYVIPRIADLSRSEQEMFQRYIFW